MKKLPTEPMLREYEAFGHGWPFTDITNFYARKTSDGRREYICGVWLGDCYGVVRSIYPSKIKVNENDIRFMFPGGIAEVTEAATNEAKIYAPGRSTLDIEEFQSIYYGMLRMAQFLSDIRKTQAGQLPAWKKFDDVESGEKYLKELTKPLHVKIDKNTFLRGSKWRGTLELYKIVELPHPIGAANFTHLLASETIYEEVSPAEVARQILEKGNSYDVDYDLRAGSTTRISCFARTEKEALSLHEKQYLDGKDFYCGNDVEASPEVIQLWGHYYLLDNKTGYLLINRFYNTPDAAKKAWNKRWSKNNPIKLLE